MICAQTGAIVNPITIDSDPTVTVVDPSRTVAPACGAWEGHWWIENIGLLLLLVLLLILLVLLLELLLLFHELLLLELKLLVVQLVLSRILHSSCFLHRDHGLGFGVRWDRRVRCRRRLVPAYYYVDFEFVVS